MTLEDHSKCEVNQNKSKSFGTTWMGLLETHLVSNFMINTVKHEYMLFRTNYKKGLDFPCLKKFSECPIPEADVLHTTI